MQVIAEAVVNAGSLSCERTSLRAASGISTG